MVDGKPVVTPNWVYTCDDVGRNIVDIWVVLSLLMEILFNQLWRLS